MFVKICGITTVADGLLCAKAGCDAIGLNLVPGSTRQIEPTLAGEIARALPDHVAAVGVFRSQSPQFVIDTVRAHNLEAAQLHGEETIEETQWIAQRLPWTIKAFTAGAPGAAHYSDWGTDPVLLDAAEPGSGHTLDWTTVKLDPGPPHVLLAGGLHPANVAEAIATIKPWGVDAATGVEQSPGIKDPKLVIDFVRRAKEVATDAKVNRHVEEPQD